MRKSVFAFFTVMFSLAGGVVAASAMAKPVDPAPVQFAVTGTFSAGPAEAGSPFAGTVMVDRFIEQDGQLAVLGALTSSDDALFAPLAVSVFASAHAFDVSGCAVEISTANAFIDPSFIIFLDGASFALTESTNPDSARELCRVVQTATKDPADQNALARALNKVLAAH